MCANRKAYELGKPRTVSGDSGEDYNGGSLTSRIVMTDGLHVGGMYTARPSGRVLGESCRVSIKEHKVRF